MRIQWLGGPSFRLEMGQFIVAGDPVLAAEFNLSAEEAVRRPAFDVKRVTPLPDASLADANVLMVTRWSPDHIDDEALARLADSCTVVVPKSDTANVPGRMGNIRAVEWGDRLVFERGAESLTITAVPASIPDRENPGNGYIITHTADDKTYTVYWTGDTRWFNEARDIAGSRDTVNLMIVNLGAVGAGHDCGLTSLDAKEAMQLVFQFQPKRLLPIGHSTFSHYTEPIGEFKSRVDLTMYDRRLVLLGEGEWFERDS